MTSGRLSVMALDSPMTRSSRIAMRGAKRRTFEDGRLLLSQNDVFLNTVVAAQSRPHLVPSDNGHDPTAKDGEAKNSRCRKGEGLVREEGNDQEKDVLESEER